MVLYLCFFVFCVQVDAEDPYETEALVLNELGLFKGTDQGFDLESIATRAQGAVMLTRFMGVEEASIEAYEQGMITHPFQDVPSWASPHVAFLFSEGLTKGISQIRYGADLELTGEQYITMLLRSLGYDDSKGDFLWNASLDFLNSTYDVSIGDLNAFRTIEKTGMNRGVMVRLSYLTLGFNYKNLDNRVLDRLYFNEVFSEALYEKYGGSLNKEAVSADGFDFDERRGVWFSYLELGPVMKNASELEYKVLIGDMYDQVLDDGFNTVYFQVRSFSEAIYPSEVYSWSYLLGDVGVDGPGYDPLKIAIELAHDKGLRFEAWINPYRVRTNIQYNPVEPDDKLMTLMDDPSNVFQIGDLVTLNPAKVEVRQRILDGVEEVVLGYDIDGIQFDDYFYPNSDMDLDDEDYESYLKTSTWISQGDFRRKQVTILLKDTYDLIHSLDSTIDFGISPQGSLGNNYDHVFLDVKEVINLEVVDYVLPQVYYGFNNQHSPYEKVINEWDVLIGHKEIDLLIGLSAYKIGLEDRWAGTGSDEWMNERDLLSHMVISARSLERYKGVSVFRYDSLYKPSLQVKGQVDGEREGLSELFYTE